MGEHEHGDNVDRRNLLKKTAVAGGIIWAAPTVASFGAGVAAQSPVDPGPCEGPPIITPAPTNPITTGQFAVTTSASGLYTVSWPIQAACPCGTQAGISWQWEDANSVSVLSTAVNNCAPLAANNVSAASLGTGATTTLQRANCTDSFGYTLRVTATVTCPNEPPLVLTRTERVRASQAATNADGCQSLSVAYFPC